MIQPTGLRAVIGLGNPGREYEHTRHNVGFDVIRRLALRNGIVERKRQFSAVLGDGTISGVRTLLARPMTYMNLSGNAVGRLCRWYRIAPGDVIVVYDDVALPAGKLRLRYQGSAGGHNGMKSIIASLGTDSVPRVRVGVGAPGGGELIDHVLGRFGKADREAVDAAIELAAEAVETALANGFEAAMNRYNA